VAPESDWKLNHLARTNRTRPTVNHLVQNGQVTVRVCDPTVGRTRRSRAFRHRSANDGWCDSEKTRKTRHCVPRTCLVTDTVRFAIPVEITTVGRNEVHHLVVPRGRWIARFTPIGQTTVILEDAFCNSSARRERQTPRLVSRHVSRDIFVDRSQVVQPERIVVAIVVVTTH